MAVYRTSANWANLHCGMIVWAYAFQETREKEGMHLSQVPVKGRLTFARNHLVRGDFGPENVPPRFFVPFKKNSETECAWSKAVKVYSREYADTEEEAKVEYNRIVDKQIQWYQEKISALEGIKL